MRNRRPNLTTSNHEHKKSATLTDSCLRSLLPPQIMAYQLDSFGRMVSDKLRASHCAYSQVSERPNLLTQLVTLQSTIDIFNTSQRTIQTTTIIVHLLLPHIRWIRRQAPARDFLMQQRPLPQRQAKPQPALLILKLKGAKRAASIGSS